MREVHSWMLQVPGLDVQRFSGVSFRKGCLQELHRAGQSRIQIATQAAHRSIQSQRWYISLDSRVQQQNAHVLAAALHGLVGTQCLVTSGEPAWETALPPKQPSCLSAWWSAGSSCIYGI